MPEPTVDPSIQSRLRQLLNLRGGPLVSVADFVQPVAVLSAWSEFRNPTLEVGDQLPPQFTSEFSVAAVAGQNAEVSIRVPGGTGLLHWIKRAFITDLGGAGSFAMSITRTALSHGAFGTAAWMDGRLPSANLVASAVDIGGGATAAPQSQTGFLQLEAAAASTMIVVECDHVLVDPDLIGVNELIVLNRNVNRTTRVSFQGYVFNLQR